MSARIKIEYEDEEASSSKRSAEEMNSNDDDDLSLPSTSRGVTSSSSKASKVTPLVALRGGYLSVSDFVRQVWCEKSLVYSLTTNDFKENCLTRTGKRMHRKRDLEVNEYVKINCSSFEDDYAIHLLNLLSALYETQHQLTTSLREVPVFGKIHDIFLMGRIDELRVDYEDFQIDLVEFKTRNFKQTPSDAQSIKLSVQSMLYTKMFNDLVTGNSHVFDFMEYLQLDIDKPLGREVKEHIEDNLGFLKQLCIDDVWTLRFLLDNITSMAQFLPKISRSYIEFAWQFDEKIFHIEEIKYDVAWIERKLKPCISFWHGERDSEGVDMEEIWKCKNCEFRSRCNWRHYLKDPWRYRHLR